MKGFWLAVIIGGVIWLKLADSPKLEAKKSDNRTAMASEQHQ